MGEGGGALLLSARSAPEQDHRQIAGPNGVRCKRRISDEAVGHGQSPFEALVDREKLERYKAVSNASVQIEREAIIGYIELQLSFEELAVALGKPSANAARVAMRRAVASLIREMGQ